MSKKRPSLRISLAAARLRILELEGRPIPLEDAKAMTAHQINSLFHDDHFPIAEEFGGPTEPWNLCPRLIKEHRHKSATKDIPEIRKSDRIREDHEEHRRKMLTKLNGDDTKVPPRKLRMGRRPMPGSKDSGWKIPMRGKPVRRETI